MDEQTRSLIACGFLILGVVIIVARHRIAGAMTALYRRLGIEVPSIPPTLISIAVLVMACLGFVVYTALHISHRVAGPSYRMRQTMKAFRSGDTEVRARLRKGDYLTKLADELNELLDWTQQQIAEVRSNDESDVAEEADQRPGVASTVSSNLDR